MSGIAATGKVKVKKANLRARDIQENCLRIKAAMEKTKVGTPEWKTLADDLAKQQDILKKYYDAKWQVPKEAAVIGGTAVAFIFLIGLSREWPSALKLGSVVLKMFPFKGI